MSEVSSDPIPWEELKCMPDIAQAAWWSGVLHPTSRALLDKLSRHTGRPYTDCVVALIGDNIDEVKRLVMAKRARRAAQGEAPAVSDPGPGESSEYAE